MLKRSTSTELTDQYGNFRGAELVAKNKKWFTLGMAAAAARRGEIEATRRRNGARKEARIERRQGKRREGRRPVDQDSANVGCVGGKKQ